MLGICTSGIQVLGIRTSGIQVLSALHISCNYIRRRGAMAVAAGVNLRICGIPVLRCVPMVYRC